MTKWKSLRLPEPLLEKLEALAKAKGVKFSSAVRWALNRGLTAIESDDAPPAPNVAPQQRRVISRGVT